MELGLDFEDEDFTEKEKEDQRQPLTSYNAKVCNPLWFEDADTSDPETASSIYKYRGDNFYFHGEYDKAIGCYKDGLEKLPVNNRCMRHDLTESLSRCYLHTERHIDAVELAEELVRIATNNDQKMQGLTLLCQIENKMGNTEGEITTLQQLIMIHPFNVEFWLKLELCYRKQYKSLFPWKPGTEQYIRIVTCLIRARLLLRSVRTAVGSFVKERHQRLLTSVDEKLSELEISEETRYKAKKHLGEDIFKLDQKDSTEDEAKSQANGNEEVDFNTRWFTWTL